jgi:lysophospholipase L1-like esterase
MGAVRERLAAAREHGDHHAQRVAQILSESHAWQPGSLLLLGDDAIERFPYREAFRDSRAINMGINGDKIATLLDRMDLVALADPQTIWLAIGSSDLVWRETKPTAVLAGEYRELLAALQAAAPRTQIIVFSVPPASGGFAGANARIRELNESIREATQVARVRFIDLTPFLSGEDGRLRQDCTTDGRALTLRGYLEWLRAGLTKPEFIQSVVGIAPLWKRIGGRERNPNKINPESGPTLRGSREEGELVVYTPDYSHASTLTNQWGIEATVVGGKVVGFTRGDSLIPRDGLVVSGHGEAAQWIAMNLWVGCEVELREGRLEVGLPVPLNLDAARKLALMENAVIVRLATQPDDAVLRAVFSDLAVVRRDLQFPETQERVRGLWDNLFTVYGW